MTSGSGWVLSGMMLLDAESGLPGNRPGTIEMSHSVSLAGLKLAAVKAKTALTSVRRRDSLFWSQM